MHCKVQAFFQAPGLRDLGTFCAGREGTLALLFEGEGTREGWPHIKLAPEARGPVSHNGLTAMVPACMSPSCSKLLLDLH